MRKFALAAVAMIFSVGLALAAEVTFVNFDAAKGELTVKDGDKEATYKVTDKTAFKVKDADGNVKDVENAKGIKGLERLAMNEKAKGKAKLDIELEDKDVKTITTKAPKKK